MLKFDQYINGQWVAPSNGLYTEVYNPSDDSVVALVADGDENDANAALECAESAQKTWRNFTAGKRAEYVYAFVDEIKKKRLELAEILTKEQGKLYKVALFEVDACCSFLKYACEWARRIEGDILPSDHPNEQIHIQKIPRGVVVAITAWNRITSYNVCYTKLLRLQKRIHKWCISFYFLSAYIPVKYANKFARPAFEYNNDHI